MIVYRGEHHLGYPETEILGKSLYELLHPEDVHEVKEKHMQREYHLLCPDASMIDINGIHMYM